MPRSRDLDTVAPDDMVTPAPISTSEPKTDPVPKSDPPPKSPPKTHHKKTSKNSAYRKKVYELIDGVTKTSFSAFLARPKVFTFGFREADEEIILVLRRHWATNVPWIFTAIIMALAPLLLNIFPLLNFFPTHFRFVFILFWYLITFAAAFEKFLSWYFNVFIITEERVIDIDFFNLLDKKISEAKISMIQDVTSVVGGLTQTLLNYGSVLIQTAAEIPLIKIDKIPNPNLVLKILQQMRGEEEEEALEGRLK